VLDIFDKMYSLATGSAWRFGLGIGATLLPARSRRGPIQIYAGSKTPSWELEKPERLWEAGGELWWVLSINCFLFTFRIEQLSSPFRGPKKSGSLEEPNT
jgi:hypothetical protein